MKLCFFLSVSAGNVIVLLYQSGRFKTLGLIIFSLRFSLCDQCIFFSLQLCRLIQEGLLSGCQLRYLSHLLADPGDLFLIFPDPLIRKQGVDTFSFVPKVDHRLTDVDSLIGPHGHVGHIGLHIFRKAHVRGCLHLPDTNGISEV